MDFVVQKYEKFLDPTKRNRLVTVITLHPITKALVNFSVLQLYLDKSGISYQVIKHDFSHGCYNIHKYYLGHLRRVEIRDRPLSNSLVYEVKQSIQADWIFFRNEFLRRFLPAELIEWTKQED